MTRVVYLPHLLDEDGTLPFEDPPRARRALRCAQFVEYAGPLAVGQTRETLVPCSRRPGRKACRGLTWVLKPNAETIEAVCLVCGATEVVITGWDDTDWADGPMEPARISEIFDIDPDPELN